MSIENIVLEGGLLKSGVLHGVIAEAFGIEFSDEFSFLTLTEEPRFTYTTIEKSSSSANASFCRRFIQMAQGEFILTTKTSVDTVNRFIEISASLESKKDTYIQDFVVRMKFRKEGVSYANINNLRLVHLNSQKYSQHECDHVELVCETGASLRIERIKAERTDNSVFTLYARDLNDHWIVHSRLIPGTDPDRYNLRWINRYFWLSAHDKLSRMLSRFKPLKNWLWYRKERIGRKAAEYQLIGLMKFPASSTINQTVRIYF